MYLKHLALKNFRCFECLESFELEKLAILIGENDAGKTVILDAVETLLSNRPISESDLRQSVSGGKSTTAEIQGRFVVEHGDEIPEEYISGDSRDEFVFKKSYQDGRCKISISGHGFEEERFDRFQSLKADEQKELLESYGVTPGTNSSARILQFNQLAQENKLALVEREIEIEKISILQSFIPRVERIASSAYTDPQSLIQATLRSVASRVLNPPEPNAEERQDLEGLAKVKAKIEAALNAEVKKFEETLKMNHKRFQGIFVDSTVDFTKAIGSSTLIIDLGDVKVDAGDCGDGTKRRLWMGILEWQQVVAREEDLSVIRLYDEPDVNLHYEAQRVLFSNITDLTRDANKKIQCIVATHSLTLIDRAPLSSIAHIAIGDGGSRALTKINADPADSDVVNFLHEIGRSVGLSNSSILYEKAFLLVEGESEENSIPILYHRVYGRSLIEDGIVLINLLTNGGWKPVMRTLLSNRQPLVHLLLDSDCQSPDSTAKVNLATLSELGYTSEFLGEQLTYIGMREYEDVFSNNVIVGTLNLSYPRADETEWEPSQIEDLRQNGNKFSDQLRNLVRGACTPDRRSEASKPKLAELVAQNIAIEDIPSEILTCFAKVRRQAGVEV